MRARPKRSCWISAATILTATLTTTLAVPAPAHAALPGAVVKDDLTAFDLTTPKTANALCPPGTRVTGGGGRISGGAGRVVLTRMEPVHTNNRDRYEVTAAAGEIGPAAPWAVQAFAVCAAPLPDQEIIDATIVDDGHSYRARTASCPVAGPGRATGGGGRVTNGQGQVSLAASGHAVTGLRQGSRAAGVEDLTGYGGSWDLTAYTVCTSVDSGVRTRSDTAPLDLTSVKSATAECLPGQSVTGGGGSLFDVSFQGPAVVLESVVPEVLPGGVPGDEVRVIARATGPTDESWTVTAHAYCAG